MNSKIKHFRENLGLTPEDMAEKLEISASYYYKLESGLRTPSFKVLQKYKAAFGANLDSIFFEQNVDESSKTKLKKSRHKRAS